MDQHLRVGLGVKAMAFANQVVPQFRVVEDLTVEGDPQGFVFVMDGLIAAGGQIDDA
jgi:hypothetical protein